MKISKVEVVRRNEIAVKFFKENPEATGAAFNALLISSGETRKMALVTVYKLRDQARAEIGWVAKGNVPAVAAPETVATPAEAVNG